MPINNQLMSSFLVAVFSGFIATTLFFKATNLANDSPNILAAIESTQVTEIVFTILGRNMLGNNNPSMQSLVGIGLIIVGITLGSFLKEKHIE